MKLTHFLPGGQKNWKRGKSGHLRSRGKDFFPWGEEEFSKIGTWQQQADNLIIEGKCQAFMTKERGQKVTL